MRLRAISLLILITGAAGAAGDFCNCEWGWSPEQVKAVLKEPGNVKEVNGCLTYGYTGKWEGAAGVFFFHFTRDGKLARAGIIPEEEDSLAPFHAWVKALEASAGAAENRDKVYTDDPALLEKYYRGDAAAQEEGIRAGYFELFRVWETHRSYADVGALERDGKIAVGLTTYSQELREQYDREVKGE